ncbi:MAG: hypothetical protein Q8P67_20525, partial [archaeon]|nr:hypothetical protein [archaeon]
MSLVGLSDHAQAIIKQCKDQLLDLTFNCKLRINGLTQLAEENLDLAPHIVACIERRLLTAPPEHVLPSLYVYFKKKSFFLFLFEIFIFFQAIFWIQFRKMLVVHISLFSQRIFPKLSGPFINEVCSKHTNAGFIFFLSISFSLIASFSL